MDLAVRLSTSMPGTFYFTIHCFLPESFPQVPLPPVIALPALALGLQVCPTHVLTTKEVFARLRLRPQRSLEPALWEEPVSFHSGMPGVAGKIRALGGQTGEQV